MCYCRVVVSPLETFHRWRGGLQFQARDVHSGFWCPRRGLLLAPPRLKLYIELNKFQKQTENRMILGAEKSRQQTSGTWPCLKGHAFLPSSSPPLSCSGSGLRSDSDYVPSPVRPREKRPQRAAAPAPAAQRSCSDSAEGGRYSLSEAWRSSGVQALSQRWYVFLMFSFFRCFLPVLAHGLRTIQF